MVLESQPGTVSSEHLLLSFLLLLSCALSFITVMNEPALATGAATAGELQLESFAPLISVLSMTALRCAALLQDVRLNYEFGDKDTDKGLNGSFLRLIHRHFWRMDLPSRLTPPLGPVPVIYSPIITCTKTLDDLAIVGTHV